MRLKSIAGFAVFSLGLLMGSTPAFARGGGGHGGGHSSHNGSHSYSSHASRGSHAGHSRGYSHARSGFRSSHVSRYAGARTYRPSASSEHLVSSHYRRDGTFVQSYYATNADGTRNNNYSTRGNINPHTGVYGTKPRDGE